jgi:hypothetical protein
MRAHSVVDAGRTVRSAPGVMASFRGLVLGLAVVSCGGTKEPAATPASAPASERAAPAETPVAEAPEEEATPEPVEEAKGLPTECAGSGDLCTPPRDFVDRLCQGVYLNVALVMFRQGTPWTRAYLTRKTEAWNASGGASVAGFLEFDEEVIVLKHRKAPSGGMQVSGAGGGYEALRWNGACVTLSGEEVTLRRPPQPKYAKVEWKYIDPSMRDALKEDDKVREAFATWRHECKGVTMGAVSKACETADAKLSKLVVAMVNRGGTLAEPEKLPE